MEEMRKRQKSEHSSEEDRSKLDLTNSQNKDGEVVDTLNNS